MVPYLFSRFSCVIVLLGMVFSFPAQGQFTPGYQPGYLERMMNARAQAMLKAKLQTQPEAVVFNSTTSSIALRITNPLDTAVSVDCTLSFMYSQVGPNGQLVSDSVGSGSFAAAHDMSTWVKGLPSHITLAAHETQTIQLTVAVPANLKDDVYWATLVAVSRKVPLKWGSMIFHPEDVTMTIPIVYNRKGAAATLELRKPLATVVEDSLLRVCLPLHRNGTGLAAGTLHVDMHTGNKGDTTVTQSLAVYDDMAPCLVFPISEVPPGSYKVDVSITGDSTVAATSVPPVHSVLPFTITPEMRTAMLAARAKVAADLEGVFSNVTLTPEQGSLLTQLAAEVKKAQAKDRVPLLDVGASWCQPCHELDRAMRSPDVLLKSMQGTYVIHVDLDQFNSDLRRLGVPTRSVPTLVTLDHTGHPTKDYFGAGIVGDERQKTGESIAAWTRRCGAPIMQDYVAHARTVWESEKK